MVQSQARQARLHQRPRRKARAVDQHVEFSAAAGVAAHSVVLVEINLARIHHLPEGWEGTLLKTFICFLFSPRSCRGAWEYGSDFSKGFQFLRVVVVFLGFFILQTDLTSGGIKTGRGRYCLLSPCIDLLQQQEQVQTRQKGERHHSAARSRVIWSRADDNAASLWNVLAKPTADRLSTSAN